MFVTCTVQTNHQNAHIFVICSERLSFIGLMQNMSRHEQAISELGKVLNDRRSDLFVLELGSASRVQRVSSVYSLTNLMQTLSRQE